MATQSEAKERADNVEYLPKTSYSLDKRQKMERM